MKRILTLFVAITTVFVLNAQTVSGVSCSVSPTTFEETQSITVTFTNVNESSGGFNSTDLYLWAWTKDVNGGDMTSYPNNGDWSSSSAASKLTRVSAGTYQMTLTPNTYFGVTGIGKVGFLIKTQNGGKQSSDFLFNVGSFQLTLISPTENVYNLYYGGTSLSISATNTGGNATYALSANGTIINTQTTSSYSYTDVINESRNYQLDVTLGGVTKTKKFYAIKRPTVVSETIPTGMENGINYDSSDPTKATLVLDAPQKDFVIVVGSFSNWLPNDAYVMKKDATAGSTKFWITLTGLTPQQIYTFQYFTVATSTSKLVRVADPFSTLVLSPDDDPWINSDSMIYPNLPEYPSGQMYDVSVLQTGKAPYNWQVTNFAKPAKEDLVIYELLVRDFQTGKSWQSLIDNFDYFKNLKINAIELMPVMEFEGNNSWGYNPVFHLALDKAYGTPEKFKEFIDLCHQNGIAIILDVALNHAFDRSPLQRMWNTSTDGGYGDVASGNPYFNQTAKHAYNVGYDFNASARTQYYVKRVVKQWIEEFKVDGFRWDLTKGFTQSCTANDETCTNAYQADRVQLVKQYTDYQLLYDPSSYAIVEHLGVGGSATEEAIWANYEDGIMPWAKVCDPMDQVAMGYSENSNFSGFYRSDYNKLRAVGYSESHDEERVAYKALANGNSYGEYDIKTPVNYLKRMEAIGAVSLLIPGPKMIWQFEELGYDKSIHTCSNGVIGSDCRTDPKPSAFSLGYFTDTNRKNIYDTWAKLIDLKKNNNLFKTQTFNLQVANSDLLPRIYLWTSSVNTTDLSYSIIVANFTLSTTAVTPYFPWTGNWYNLMDNSVYNVSDVNQTITLAPGEFRVFGNNQKTLSTEDTPTKLENNLELKVAPNPIVNKIANVIYSAKGATNLSLSVISLDGKTVSSVKLPSNEGNYELPLNFPTGTYIILMNSDKGNKSTKVILK